MHSFVCSSSPVFPRRRLALLSIVTAFGVAVSSCTTDVFTQEVTPNQDVLSAYAASAQRADDGDRWSAMFAEQSRLLREEFLRLCGKNADGEYPSECTDALEGASTDLTVQQALLAAIDHSAEDEPTDVGLLAGMYAATATEQSAPELAQVRAFSADSVAQGVTGQEGELQRLLELVYPAIYATGVAMAADRGNNRAVLQAITDRLRLLRDSTIKQLELSHQDVPVAQASYFLEGATPADSASAANYLHEALVPVTAQLRMLASVSTTGDARVYHSRWAGLTARAEAAVESIGGQDPSQQVTRGQQAGTQ